MLQKRDLIIIGTNWSSCPPASRQLFLQLASGRRVLWVCHSLTGVSGEQNEFSDEAMAPSPIHYLQVTSMPWGHTAWLQTINQRWIAKQIRNTIDFLALHNPILLFLDPSASTLAESLNIETVIYYRDELATALLDNQSDHAQESRLIAKASLLVASTPSQAATFPAYKTCLLRHESHAIKQARPRDLPSGRPIIGFHGPLDDDLDWELLERAARRRPDWYWVLIGPRKTQQLDRLLRLHNVFWLGEKSDEQLQCYRQHWQVTLFPYRNLPHICRHPPILLDWMLQQTKPIIVSADFVGLPHFKPLLSRVHSMQELTELLPITGGERPQQTAPRTRPFQQQIFYSADMIRQAEMKQQSDRPNWELGADEFGLLLDNL